MDQIFLIFTHELKQSSLKLLIWNLKENRPGKKRPTIAKNPNKVLYNRQTQPSQLVITTTLRFHKLYGLYFSIPDRYVPYFGGF